MHYFFIIFVIIFTWGCSSSSPTAPTPVISENKKMLRSDIEISSLELIPEGSIISFYIKRDVLSDDPSLYNLRAFVLTAIPELDFEKIKKLPFTEGIAGLVQNPHLKNLPFTVAKSDEKMPITKELIVKFAKDNQVELVEKTINDLPRFEEKTDATFGITSLSSHFVLFGDSGADNLVMSRYSEAKEGRSLASPKQNHILIVNIDRQFMKPFNIPMQNVSLQIERNQNNELRFVMEASFSGPIEKQTSISFLEGYLQNYPTLKKFWNSEMDQGSSVQIRKNWALDQLPTADILKNLSLINF